VFDTQQTVISNLETLCTAASSWLNFDVNSGLWSVVINQAGTSTASFNDTNIIGNINISGTGITELYNSVRVTFPHKDLNDQGDIITLSTPAGDRFSNEQDNTLEINFDVINDPIRAEMIGLTELKQSHVDKIIEFRTDFSKMGVKAGDLIDVTASMYGFTSKLFRVIRISEEDGDDNSIQISITALEYDADVYDYTDLEFYPVTRENGVVSKNVNTTILNSDYQATTNQVSNALGNTSDTTAVDLLNANLTTYTNLPGLYTGFNTQSVASTQSVYASFAANPSGTFILAMGFSFLHINPNITATQPWKFIQFNIEIPKGDFSYTLGGTPITIGGNFASYIFIYYINRLATSVGDLLANGTELTVTKAEYQTATVTWAAENAVPGYYYILAQPITFSDLSVGSITPTGYTTIAQGSGGGFTVSGFVLE
jgi:hypothetical protein